MNSTLFHLLFITTVAGGGTVLFSAEQPAPAELKTAETTPAPSAVAPPQPVVYSPPVVLNGTPQQIAATVQAVLARTNTLDRVAGEIEVLKQMSPENSQAIRHAYLRNTSPNRPYGMESGQLYFRLGQENGVKLYLPKLPQQPTATLSTSSAWLIEGWASRQPAEAVEWFKTWPLWKIRGSVAKAVMRGLEGADVALAEAFANEADADVRLQVLPVHFSTLVGKLGFSKAMSWAEKNLVPKPGATPTPQDEAAAKALFAVLLEAAVQNLNHDRLREFWARHSFGTYFSRNDAYKIVEAMEGTDPTILLDWMTTVALALEGEGCPMGLWRINERWIDEDEAALNTWIKTKLDHPLRDYVVWTYAHRLGSRGQLDEGRKLILTMKSETNRSGSLGQFESKYAPKAPASPTP